MAKTPGKRLRGKVTIPGAEKPIWVSAHSRKELEEKKRIVRETYVDGVKPRDLTFHQAVIEWYTVIKRPRIRTVATRGNYEGMINNHILPCFPEQRLVRTIRRKDLQACVDRLEGFSMNSVNLCMSILRHSMEYAVTENAIASSPAALLVRPLTCKPKDKDALTDAQRDAVFAAADASPDGRIVYILYYLGLRIGEALGLQWGDFDWENELVHVQRDIDFSASNDGTIGSVKNDTSDRFVPIPEPLKEHLWPLRGMPSAFVILMPDGSRPSKSQYRSMWLSLMHAAGMTTLKPEYIEDRDAALALGLKPPTPSLYTDYDVLITAHWFRHNYATLLFEGGVDPITAMRILGHSNYSTTANVYTHLKEKQLRKAAVKMDAVFAKGCQKVAIF